MDRETKEYLERILLGLTTKEDLEKLRQETKSNFRQLKEESKNQALEWREEVKADFERLPALDQSIQKLETLLQDIKEERETHPAEVREGASTDVSGLKDGIERLREGIKEVTEEILYIKEKMKDGFVEVQSELGSMIRFSYADLERRFNALEARIKALEKMVFP